MASRDYYFYASASDKNATNTGVEAQVYVVKIQFNSSFTSFTYQSDHYSRRSGATTSNEIIQAQLQIYINDNIVVDSNVYDIGTSKTWSGSLSCSSPNKVRVYAKTWAGADDRYWQATAVVDITYYLHHATSTLTVASTDTHKNIILPLSTSNSGAIRFIKNIRTNNDYYVFITTFSDDSMEVSGANRLLYIWKYECATFMPAPNIWYLVNYYTNSIRNTNVIVPVEPSGKIATASIGVNIFNVDDISARQSGDNQVILPTAQSGQMCIVIYAGNSVRKSWGNALSFKSNNSLYGIDKRFNNTNDFPYIGTDEDGVDEGKKKSTGIVFISDGTYWYIVGWYRAWCQGWENRSIVSSTQLTPSSYINFNYTPNTLSSDTYYTLPQYNVNDAGKNYFYIFKSTNVSGGVGIVLSANPPGIDTNPPTATTNIFNEGMNITYRGCCGGKGYQYVWVISYVKPGESRLRWYPILNDYANNGC
jgi:hypothetical protein